MGYPTITELTLCGRGNCISGPLLPEAGGGKVECRHWTGAYKDWASSTLLPGSLMAVTGSDCQPAVVRTSGDVVGRRQRGRKRRILFSIVGGKFCGVEQTSPSPSRNSQDGEETQNASPYRDDGEGVVPPSVWGLE